MTTASVVTWHTPSQELAGILHLLESEPIAKTWVIDNGCEKRIAGICAGFDKAIYIPCPGNPGYGTAHNIALEEAVGCGAHYHLVLNSDISFAAGAVAQLTDYMDSHADVGMAQPRLVDSTGADIHSCRLLPTPFDLIVRRFMPSRWFKKRREEYLLTHLDPEREHNIPYHQGSFMMLRLAAVKQCGGFDERFFMYPEDIDLTRRIHRSWRTMYVPQPTVVHAHRAESYKSLRMTAIHAINIICYFNKWGWLRDPERTLFNSPLLKKNS